jgi:hypothetical protein
LSPIADMSAHPSAFGVVTRIPKRERPRKHARIAVKLDTVMGVAREMGRLIRLSYNGHLPPEELTKYIFSLDKLRTCLESAIAVDDAAVERAKTEPTTLCVNVIAVPEGHYQQADGSFRPNAMLQIEHTPEPERGLESSHEPERAGLEILFKPEPEFREPNPSPREALEARLATLPDRMLLALAGVDDADAE